MATITGSAANVIGPFVSAAAGLSYDLDYTPGTTIGEENPCLSNVLPSYLYQQYQDDDDLQAFVTAFNGLAQQYVDWLNSTPLPVYTSPAITGDLLDWVAKGLYGVDRPILGSGDDRSVGALNTYAVNGLGFNVRRIIDNRVFTPVTDDIFKRVLTWKLYKGDGKVMNVMWLKRRVYRFLMGADGTDVDAADTQQISVTFSYGDGVTITVITDSYVTTVPGALFNAFTFNSFGFNLAGAAAQLSQELTTYSHGNQVNINLLSRAPVGITGAVFGTFLVNSTPFNDYHAVSRSFSPLPNVEIFKEAVDQGVLDMPFQFKTVVNLD